MCGAMSLILCQASISDDSAGITFKLQQYCRHVTLRPCILAVQAFLVDGGDHTAVSTVKSVEFVGNRTECALLLMLRGWGHDYKSIRDSHRTTIKKVYTFSSATKMASVLVQMTEDTYRLYVKVRHV